MKYFISCKINAAFPKQDERLMAYLQDHGNIGTVGCCRDKEQLTLQEPALVICHTCASILEESGRTSDIAYVWEYIDKDPGFVFPDYQGEAITLQDCYMSKERTTVQEAVRSLLRKMNFKVVELEHNREQADFCGLRTQEPLKANQELAPKHFCEPGAITPLEAEARKAYLSDYVKRYQTARVVTNCGACRMAMKQGGANVVHLLELLFPNK